MGLTGPPINAIASDETAGLSFWGSIKLKAISASEGLKEMDHAICHLTYWLKIQPNTVDPFLTSKTRYSK